MTNKRARSLKEIHIREDQGLRKAMGAGIQARRNGVAREDNPMHGHAWRRAWFGGFDYEDRQQIVKEHPEIGAPTTQPPALGE